MKININIICFFYCIFVSGCIETSSEEILNYNYFKINEDESNIITSFSYFRPINDSLIVITDEGSGYAYFITIKGKFLDRITPPLEFVDSIAANQVAASKYMGEYYRYLFLNKVTYPPYLENAGEQYPIELINEWIKRAYSQSIVLNDSVVALAASYDMYVQDMDPSSTVFSRGNEETEIIVLYNFYHRKIINIKHLNYKEDIFPNSFCMAYNTIDNQIYLGALNSNVSKSNDSIPFIITYNELNEMEIHSYLPNDVVKYADRIGLIAPDYIFNENDLFCTFSLLDKVYNLNDKTSFDIQNLSKDNIEQLDNFDIKNPKFDNMNFKTSYMGFLKNHNLLLIINLYPNSNKQEYLLQEYTKKGDLIKTRKFSNSKNEIGKILSLNGLNNMDIIFGLSYNDSTEDYYILSFEW